MVIKAITFYEDKTFKMKVLVIFQAFLKPITVDFTLYL